MIVLEILGAIIIFGVISAICDSLTHLDYIISVIIGLILAFGFNFGIGDEYKIYFVLTGLVIWLPIKLIYIGRKNFKANKKMMAKTEMVDFILSVYSSIDRYDLMSLEDDCLYKIYLEAKSDYIKKKSINIEQ